MVLYKKLGPKKLEHDFRRELAEDLTLVINEVLEKFEEFKFAGVEEVYFTGFVVQ